MISHPFLPAQQFISDTVIETLIHYSYMYSLQKYNFKEFNKLYSRNKKEVNTSHQLYKLYYPKWIQWLVSSSSKKECLFAQN